MKTTIDAMKQALGALKIADAFCGGLTADACPDTVHVPIRDAKSALESLAEAGALAVVVSRDENPDAMNLLYGEAYGVDWVYGDTKRKEAQTVTPTGCMRCNTPKKCGIHGCSPNTWPSEHTNPAQAAYLTEELLSAMETVLRISDRKHDAWDAAKAGIAAARAMPTVAPSSNLHLSELMRGLELHPSLGSPQDLFLIGQAIARQAKLATAVQAERVPMPPQSNLNDPRLTTILFSVLVKRLGGTVTVTQDDIDAVAYNRLEEEGREDGTIVFRFLERGRSS